MGLKARLFGQKNTPGHAASQNEHTGMCLHKIHSLSFSNPQRSIPQTILAASGWLWTAKTPTTLVKSRDNLHRHNVFKKKGWYEIFMLFLLDHEFSATSTSRETWWLIDAYPNIKYPFSSIWKELTYSHCCYCAVWAFALLLDWKKQKWELLTTLLRTQYVDFQYEAELQEQRVFSICLHLIMKNLSLILYLRVSENIVQ